MGARSSRAGYDSWDKSNIQQATGLSAEDIQELQSEFNQAAERDGTLDINKFAGLYARFPSAQKQRRLPQQVARIFQTFDRDRTGKLSFDEFLSVAIMFNGYMPRQDRIAYVIQQNNPGGYQQTNPDGYQQNNGRISSQYGHQVFRRLIDYYGLPQGTEHQCWKQVDQQNRGYVTQDEFMDYIAQQPAYTKRDRLSIV